MALEDSTDDTTPAKRAAKCGHESLRQVQAIFATLSIELQGDKFWRYQRQVSPGLQEYIEALSFAYFLDHGSLITFDQVQATLSDPNGIPYFPLPISDYFLGLSDLTGELMRFAISGISHRGGREKASDVCAFVREFKADFEQITPYIPDLRRKQVVTSQSLEKIEDTAYAIVVRSSEYDLPKEILNDIVAKSISKFAGNDDHGRDARTLAKRQIDDTSVYEGEWLVHDSESRYNRIFFYHDFSILYTSTIAICSSS